MRLAQPALCEGRLGRLSAAWSLALLIGTVASAQTVNPRLVEFTPSADHSTTLSSGQPAVARYDLQVFSIGATAPFHTVDMGKPAPQSDGFIRYDFSGGVPGWPLPGGTYEARVAAVGPAGTSQSTPSNSFTFQTTTPPPPDCLYTLTPASASFLAGGGSGSFTVTTSTGCAWTAASSATWVTVGTPSGSATGPVSYTVAANTATTARSATITAGGQTFTVSQAGAACTYSISPTSQAFGAAGGSGGFTVTTTSGCTWSASTGAGWIALGSTQGSGSGSVPFTVSSNTSTSPRSAVISAGGKSFTASQEGAACTYSVSPGTQSVGAGGGTGTVSVSTQAGCAWTAGSNATWLRVVSGASGSGNGQVSFAADPNASASARSAAIAVQGQAATVSQDGLSCSYAVEPATASVPSAGGSGSFGLATGGACSWSVSTSQGWLTASPMSGTGPTNITYTVSKNASKSSRTATLTIGTATFTVTVSSGKTPGKPRNLSISVGQ